MSVCPQVTVGGSNQTNTYMVSLDRAFVNNEATQTFISHDSEKKLGLHIIDKSDYF